MRFAGQRFREGSHREGRHTAQDGSIGRMAYRYQSQGLPPSMANMPEFNAGRITKTGEPEFNVGSFAEPQFGV